MASKAKRPCSEIGCRELTTERFCQDHKRQDDQRRGSAAQRGYDARWRSAREAYLRQHPLCVDCMKDGKAMAASVVDHIVAHKGDKRKFWDRSNWQVLCKKRQDQKTVREDGGFGR
ncbi:HNH endonuclease signature motif containing protein [Brevibacillus porteri]|uniref:HNH endonuclease n=1 Tax=Brevibacillus porteri TaxID=2126350 RepID=A0ABX5FL55_9BACL|nr:HNH endonuclease signature motif containing protein [Brevibacillus porteri]MED1801704.1 HNH endonuclease signature motif containing protein [Brevibacillus porteri]MED2135276.1 HNH endonuclease signature motif containing protein [Brevibacillus porteri]MED2748010.1 HNH endonuclease signature motif containing protein [Brevibacillus porteri]MED2813752.1 HNH endonuclease signature motif containing protein [Brevibacillus porteri]MED2894748.1 HNH endonuclease signature motif containing protein [Br